MDFYQFTCRPSAWRSFAHRTQIWSNFREILRFQVAQGRQSSRRFLEKWPFSVDPNLCDVTRLTKRDSWLQNKARRKIEEVRVRPSTSWLPCSCRFYACKPRVESTAKTKDILPNFEFPALFDNCRSNFDSVLTSQTFENGEYISQKKNLYWESGFYGKKSVEFNEKHVLVLYICLPGQNDVYFW